MKLSKLIQELNLIFEKTGDCEILGAHIRVTDNFVNYDLMNQRQIAIDGVIEQTESSNYSHDGSWQ